MLLLRGYAPAEFFSKLLGIPFEIYLHAQASVPAGLSLAATVLNFQFQLFDVDSNGIPIGQEAVYAVPEPSALILASCGLVFLLLFRIRQTL